MTREKGKVDLRVKYTKMILRESLLEIMKEKPIAKITPTELCRHADINRNTFYSHYDCPEDLLKEIEEDLFSQIMNIPMECGNELAQLTKVCQIIYENRNLCAVIFSKNGDEDFLRDVISMAHDKVIAEWKAAGTTVSDDQLEMLYYFTVNGSVSIIQNWIMQGMIKSPEEIAEFIVKVISSGLYGFIKG